MERVSDLGPPATNNGIGTPDVTRANVFSSPVQVVFPTSQPISKAIRAAWATPFVSSPSTCRFGPRA